MFKYRAGQALVDENGVVFDVEAACRRLEELEAIIVHLTAENDGKDAVIKELEEGKAAEIERQVSAFKGIFPLLVAEGVKLVGGSERQLVDAVDNQNMQLASSFKIQESILSGGNDALQKLVDGLSSINARLDEISAATKIKPVNPNVDLEKDTLQNLNILVKRQLGEGF